MTTRRILGRGRGNTQWVSSGPARLRILLVLLAVAAAAAVLAAFSSSGTLSAAGGSRGGSLAAAAGGLKTATIGGATVLTNAAGFTLYSFAPDTATTSQCSGTCAQNWPPVQGPATAAGVTGTFGTITRSDGSVQATFDGHPLYTFAGDTAPGQNRGNGLNAASGLWHEITTSGSVPAGGSSPDSGRRLPVLRPAASGGVEDGQMTQRHGMTKLGTARGAGRVGWEHAGRPLPGWAAVIVRAAGPGLLIVAAVIHLDLYLTRVPDDPGDRVAVPAAGDRGVRPRAGRRAGSGQRLPPRAG
jgi:predicted lipoprotein with Yx(FWY)xxD motif